MIDERGREAYAARRPSAVVVEAARWQPCRRQGQRESSNAAQAAALGPGSNRCASRRRHSRQQRTWSFRSRVSGVSSFRFDFGQIFHISASCSSASCPEPAASSGEPTAGACASCAAPTDRPVSRLPSTRRQRLASRRVVRKTTGCRDPERKSAGVSPTPSKLRKVPVYPPHRLIDERSNPCVLRLRPHLPPLHLQPWVFSRIVIEACGCRDERLDAEIAFFFLLGTR